MIRPATYVANINNILAFFIPCVGFVEIELIGKLYLTEIYLILAFMFLAPTRLAVFQTKWPSRIILFGLCWLLSQIVSDWVNQTSYVDYSRGIAKIVFFILNFCAIYMLINGRELRLFLFGFGAAFGLIFGFVVGNSEFSSASDLWKFGYSLPLTIIIGLCGSLASGKNGERIVGPAAMFICLGVCNFLLNSRSFGGICLLVGAFLIGRHLFRGKMRYRGALANLALAAGAFLFVAVSFGVLQLYSTMAESGIFGQEAQEKYLDQRGGTASALLLTGRFENVIGISAISEAPLLGHGSWAKDKQDQLGNILNSLNMAGYDFPDYLYNATYFTTHSHIIGAWVESGILGAVFWVVVLLLIIAAARELTVRSSRLDVYVTFICLNLGWDILFSPMAGNRRFMVPFAIVVLIFYIGQSRSKSIKEVFSKHLITPPGRLR